MGYGLDHLYLASFPHCFIKQCGKSILVYSTSSEELVEFSDRASIILFQFLLENISLDEAFQRMAIELGVPGNQLKEEAKGLIQYLQKAEIVLPVHTNHDNEDAFLNLIGQMPGHFLSYIRNSDLTHLESPIGIRLQLTSACVVGCPHCYLRGSPHLNPNPNNFTEIPLHVIERVVEELMPKGLAYIQLSGGEPCLHGNFDEICIYLLNKGLPVYILTSGIGYNVAHTWKKVIEHKYKNRVFAQISIDSNEIKALHLQRPKANIEAISTLIEFLLENGIIVQSNTVITNDNHEDLEGLVEWLEQAGIQKKLFSMCKPSGKLPKEGFKKALSVQHYLSCKEQLLSINQLKDTTDDLSVTFLDLPYIDRDNDKDQNTEASSYNDHDNRILCSAGIIESVITPNCSIAPCAELSPFENMCFGNLYESNFLDIWNCPNTFREIRSVISCEECNICDYKNKCGKGCHATKMALNMQLSDPDPYCFYLANKNIEWRLANKILPRHSERF